MVQLLSDELALCRQTSPQNLLSPPLLFAGLLPFCSLSFSMLAFPASSFAGVASSPSIAALLRGSWLNKGSNKTTASSKLVVGPSTAVKAALRGSTASAFSLGPYWVVAVGKYRANLQQAETLEGAGRILGGGCG